MLDTGADISILHVDDYERLRPEIKDELHEPDITAQTATRTEIPLMGYVNIPISSIHSKQTVQARFYISSETKSLLGKEIIYKLQLLQSLLYLHIPKQELQDLHLAIDQAYTVTPTSREITGDIKARLLRLLPLSKVATNPDLHPGGITIEPVEIYLLEDATPFRAGRIPQSPEQLQQITETVRDKLKQGLLVQIDSSDYISSVMCVPKTQKKLRMVISYKTINERIKAEHFFPLPPEDILLYLKDHFVFSTLDGRSAFDQIPLHENSREFLAFATREALFQPATLPMGMKTSVSQLQRTLERVFAPLVQQHKLFIYVDDFLLIAANDDEMESLLAELYKLANKVHFRFNGEKSNLFQTSVLWAGLVITSSGITRTAKKTETFLTLDRPANAARLLESLGLLSYLRNHIVNFAFRTQPLYNILNSAIKQANGSHEKKVLQNIPVTADDWTDDVNTAFKQLQQAVRYPIELKIRDVRKQLILYTDASDVAVGFVIGQADKYDSQNPIPHSSFEILAIESHRFSGSSANWCIQDKEVSAITFAYDRFPTLMLSGSFIWFCDNLNVVKLLNRKDDIKTVKPRDKRIERLLHDIAGLSFQIYHISGESNVLADHITRNDQRVCVSLVSSIQRRLDHDVLHNIADECDHISLIQDIRSEYSITHTNDDTNLQNVNEGRYPFETSDFDTTKLSTHANLRKLRYHLSNDLPEHLRLLLASIAHNQTIHGSIDTSLHFLRLNDLSFHRNEFYCKLVCSNCLMCKIAKRNKRLVELGTPPTSNIPGELLRMDTLHMEPRKMYKEDLRYVIVLKDDCSGAVQLHATASITANSIVKILQKYLRKVPFCKRAISDNGREFRNQIVKNFFQRNNIEYLNTTPYNSESNGSVERANRDVLRSTRTLSIAELLRRTDWHKVLPSIEHRINQTPSKARAGYTPASILSGFKPEKIGEAPTEYSEAERNSMLAQVRARREKDRKARQKAREKKPQYDHRTLEIGDYVLEYSNADSKLEPAWTGPHQIIGEASEGFIKIIYSILLPKVQIQEGIGRKVPISSLQFYHDKDLDITENLKTFARYLRKYGGYIESVINIRKGLGNFELFAKFTDQQNPVWINIKEAIRLNRISGILDLLDKLLDTELNPDAVNDINACKNHIEDIRKQRSAKHIKLPNILNHPQMGDSIVP